MRTPCCNAPVVQVSWSGFGTTTVFGGSGEVADTFKGPTYLNIASTTRPSCAYTAGEVAAHYGLDQIFARGLTGKGQTIVIVDAFGSPTIQADANAFSQAMGLPARAPFWRSRRFRTNFRDRAASCRTCRTSPIRRPA